MFIHRLHVWVYTGGCEGARDWCFGVRSLAQLADGGRGGKARRALHATGPAGQAEEC